MELVLLHALPFDASMWSRQDSLTSGRFYAPTLYDLGDRLEDWADAVLNEVAGERLIVVGNSVGGSCALEMAAQASERIAALVLIGTKAKHDPDPQLRHDAIEFLHKEGIAAVWRKYWEPLFAPATSAAIRKDARLILNRLSAEQIARGINAFHTRRSRSKTLAALNCPIVCVTGEHDTAPGIQTTRLQAATARNGRLVVVPKCGHYIPLERPDALNAILEEVVTDLAGPKKLKR